MKYLYILILSCTALLSTNLAAQSHQKGTLSLQLGFDAGGHGVEYQSKYNGSIMEQDTSGTVTTQMHLGMHYNFTNWLSGGFKIGSGAYLEDPENAEADGNTLTNFALDLRFYPVNKENFNWFAGIEAGGSRLEINRIYTFVIPFYYQYEYAGNRLELYSGINWYFLKFMGINTRLGFSSHRLTMQDYAINGASQDMDNIDNTLRTRGVHFQLGLSFKIN
jgi:hypothetical protein